MKLKKYNNEQKVLQKFTNKHLLVYSKQVNNYIRKNENIYFIIEDNSSLGFLHFKFFTQEISIRMYLTKQWKENYNQFLINLIRKFVGNREQSYLTFSHLFDSVNILSIFKGIDYMDRFECGENFYRSNVRLGTYYHISDTIADSEELIDFHYLCYSDDKDYMNKNWSKLLKTFEKISLPKITYYCYDKDDILGSCIGYVIPKLDKKYLYSICVHPKYRRKSIGEYLIRLFLSSKPIKPCFLNVYRSTIPARRLYEKVGFKKVKTVQAIVRSKSKNCRSRESL